MFKTSSGHAKNPEAEFCYHRFGAFMDHLSCWTLVPTQALTKLSLSGRVILASARQPLNYFPSFMSLEVLHVTRQDKANHLE